MRIIISSIILVVTLCCFGLKAQNCQAYFSYNQIQGNTVQFIDSSSLNTSGNYIFSWDFGDGNSDSSNTSPQHTYSTPGTYVVCLSIQTFSSCFSTYCDTITVGNVLNPFNCSYTYTTDTLNNVNFNSIVSGGATPYTFNWNFGNGNTSIWPNPTNQYNSSGAYGVNMTVTDASGQVCNSYDTVYVNFCQAFFISRTRPFDSTAVFTNYSAAPRYGVNYSWDFGDGSPLYNGRNATHNYQASGSFNVNLTLNDSVNGCTSSYMDSVIISLPCSAGFTYTISSSNSALVSFTNTANNYNEILYNFGDGSVSINSNPTHVYQQSGSYIVTQRIRNTSTNCIDIYRDTLSISIPPPCQAGFTHIINQNTVYINNTASNFNSILYDFGDGSSSNSLNPTHTYSQAGVYNVCQFVVGLNNCRDTICKSITIVDQCVSDFIYQTSFDTLFLTDLSYLADTIQYDFGDGNSTFDKNPTHIYNSSGSYVVCQTITNSHGCIDSKCDTVLIAIPRCKAGFNWTNSGDTVQLFNLAKDYTSIQYDFGDGTTTNEENPIHFYAQSGKYAVKQTVLNVGRSCVDIFIDTIEVTISTSCVASFQVAIDTNLRGTLFIVNTSSNDNTHQYYWSFGDGNSDTSRLPSHSYSDNKAHEICLTVYDQTMNCTSTYCDTVGLDSNGNLLKSNGYLLKVLEGDFIGIKENKQIQARIFPNPFNDVITIDGINLETSTELFLRDLNGRIIEHKLLTTNNIELTSILNGIYFLEIRQNGASIIKKVIKQ